MQSTEVLEKDYGTGIFTIAAPPQRFPNVGLELKSCESKEKFLKLLCLLSLDIYLVRGQAGTVSWRAKSAMLSPYTSSMCLAHMNGKAALVQNLEKK